MTTPGKLVVLKLEGNLSHQGFRVMLEIGMENDRPSIEMTGELPANPELLTCLQRWQTAYRTLGMQTRIVPQAIIYGGSINRMDECRRFSRELRDRFTDWLGSASFQDLDKRLRQVLGTDDLIRVLIRAQDAAVSHLPWHFWDFVERYPKAEVALGAPTFEQYGGHRTKASRKVRILAILGNRQGIDIEADRQMLERLPNAEVKFLVEPQRHQINSELWDQAWHILFFAGHSETRDDEGWIHINPQERLTIDELKYGLQQAVGKGLELAVFNSCDGLGLAKQLAPLHLPQMIVMREPVPDKVAQEFLKYFLTAFVRGDSLYLAERRARERLQGLEGEFPCASWIPVIFQNSADPPPDWAGFLKPGPKTSSILVPNQVPKTLWAKLRLPLISSWVVTSLVMGARLTGMLEPIELFAYDRMMVIRPSEQPDSRLLLITNDEFDVRYQKQQQMLMNGSSLSDKALDLLMKKLDVHRPVAVGLDVYRDDPHFPRDQALKTHIKNLTFVCLIGGGGKSLVDIPPPAGVLKKQIGFNNVAHDADDVIRRHTIGMYGGQLCTNNSFSYQLAMSYLKQWRVQANLMPDFLQIGDSAFPKLTPHSGGYHKSGYVGGTETLLNYRATNKIAPTLSLSAVLQGKHDHELANLVPGRIVLIGTVGRSYNDYRYTPYGELPGVVIHAHMVSQILSAVQDHRTLLWWLPQWADAIVIWIWSMTGAMLALCLRPNFRLGIVILGFSGGVFFLCYGILLRGGWMPLIPSVLTLTATSGSVAYIKSKS